MHKNNIALSIMSITIFSLYSQLGVANENATIIQNTPATPAGDEIKIKVKGGGDVRWILPGKRMLDPTLFGTPAMPLGFEPHVGVALDEREKNADGSAWTTTAKPTPFSNNYKMITGKFKLKVEDKSVYDDPQSRDKVDFSTSFTSPDGLNNYTVTVNKIIPVGPEHPVMGGVGTNFVQHGTTGIGTKLMPTAFTYVAFWGIGSLSVNNVEVANNRVVHLMTTCAVRDVDYKLVFDNAVDCSKLQTHLMLPNMAITATGPIMSPVPTAFILPNGMEQPFMHIMYGHNEVSGVKTVND